MLLITGVSVTAAHRAGRAPRAVRGYSVSLHMRNNGACRSYSWVHHSGLERMGAGGCSTCSSWGTVLIAVSSSGFRDAAALAGSSAYELRPGLSCSKVSLISFSEPFLLPSNLNTWTRLPVLPASKTTA